MARTTLTTTLAMAVLAAAGCTNDEAETTRYTSAGNGGSAAMGVYGSGREDGDEIVTFEECPEAVQQTIEAHLDGGTIKEIERTTDHGEVLYEVDVQGAAGIVEFDVAADGAFRGYEGPDDDDDGAEDDDADDLDDEADDDNEGEEEIPLSDVPENVKAAAIAAVPGIVLEEAERETEDGVVIYCLEGEADGQEYEVEVSADGVVLEIEIDEDDEDEGDDDD